MNVRDPGYDPRQNHPRSGARPAGASPERRADPGRGRGSTSGGSRTPGIIGALVVVVLLFLVGLGFGSGIFGGSRASGPGAAAATSSVEPTDAAEPTDATETAGSGEPTATEPAPPASGEPVASEVPPAPILAETDVAFVPVVNFRSARSTVKAAEIEALATGGSPFKALVLVEADADGILAKLGIARGDLGKKLVTVDTAEALAASLARSRTRVGFLRADDVGPSVRALAWGGKNLFGNSRVSLATWPLVARLPGPEAPAYDPGAAWTLFAGGDILLDRGVSLAIKAGGVDYPFNGGTAKITGLCKDCSPMGWDLPNATKTGNAGAVRDLIKGADLAIANFENPAPDAFRWHSKGTTFSANPKHIAGLVDAGIDWVSLANNHIGDAGRRGMIQTMANLRAHGLAYGGLGKTYAAAHKARLLKAGGQTVALLGYDQIAKGYNATSTVAGSARMTTTALRADIKAARKAGADVVIVFPHWGVEYRATPGESQRRLGKAAIDAGADMVIGNHAHWAAGVEVYKGKPIWYALGNFVFDQTWSNYTMEGITLELTFNGKELVQIRMRPHLIMGRAQPNFLDAAGSGKFVMDQVWRGSEGLLPW